MQEGHEASASKQQIYTVDGGTKLSPSNSKIKCVFIHMCTKSIYIFDQAIPFLKFYQSK
jgi:hypothetical protein